MVRRARSSILWLKVLDPCAPHLYCQNDVQFTVTHNSGMLNTGAHRVSSGRDRRLSVRPNRDFRLMLRRRAARQPLPALMLRKH